MLYEACPSCRSLKTWSAVVPVCALDVVPAHISAECAAVPAGACFLFLCSV